MQVQFVKIDLDHGGFVLINPGSIVCIGVEDLNPQGGIGYRFTVTLVSDVSHAYEAETIAGGLAKLGISMSGLNLAR